MFTRVNGNDIYSVQFKAHAERQLAGWDTIMGLLDDTPALNAHLKNLKQQHKDKHVKKDYNIVSIKIDSLTDDNNFIRIFYTFFVVTRTDSV